MLNENGIRPKNLNEFIGQDEVKRNLSIFIKAAKSRKEALEHVLFYGSPGLGKTTLAYVLANEVEVGIRVTSGPALQQPGDLAAILTSLNPGDVLFVDEVHRLSKIIEEALYPALEDYCLDLVVGKGPSARTLRLELPRFTLVGATTRIGLVSAPLRDRFGATFRLEFYDKSSLQEIVKRSAQILGVELDPDAALEIARRSRGTPRIANRLLKRVRDFAQVKKVKLIDLKLVHRALELLSVDLEGLDKMDRKLIKTLITRFEGGPVGLETLAAAMVEDVGTIEEVIEPFLLQQGFIKRTPRGRTATTKAYKHLGLVKSETLW